MTDRTGPDHHTITPDPASSLKEAQAERQSSDVRNSEGAGPAAPAADHGQHNVGLWALTLGAIGVVYGDIGTSPIYTMREALRAAGADGLTRTDVLGVTSLLLWVLILTVSLKYVTLFLRADNQGEGGTLSLVALLQQAMGRRPGWLLALGTVGVSLFFGDALLTPAISVLSAVEGLSLITPAFEPYVLPITLAIIVALFAMQRWGTGTVSALFGPVIAIWYLTLATLGLIHLADDPSILLALNPGHAIGFLYANSFASLIVLGSVFLAVAGIEALYTGLGHFGPKPLRRAWLGFVWPALSLIYLGQGAMVLDRPQTAADPLFLMVPEWALLPLVLLATAATVIASQAVISAAFSMVKQAVRMGLLPRAEILHTSATQEGQIYLPRVNAILAAGIILLVLIFGSSSSLASAYGLAVAGNMMTTTILATLVFLRAWRWSPHRVAAAVLPFFLLEVLFVGANALKFPEGGWVSVLLAGTLAVLIGTWVRGARHVQNQARRGATPLEALIETLGRSTHMRDAPGTAVFLTSDPDLAPAALLHNLKHNKVLHERNLIISVIVSMQPVVPDAERVSIHKLSDRFTRVDLCFGYMEETNVSRALALVRKQGETFDIMSTSFFLNRRSFRLSKTKGLPRWQGSLFIAMTKWATNATSFYRLPANRVVELGEQITI